jgi:hypothetical protein
VQSGNASDAGVGLGRLNRGRALVIVGSVTALKAVEAAARRIFFPIEQGCVGGCEMGQS